MKFKVTITFRDDTVKTYICFFSPDFTDWVILYLADNKNTRKFIPKEAIKDMEYCYA